MLAATTSEKRTAYVHRHSAIQAPQSRSPETGPAHQVQGRVRASTALHRAPEAWVVDRRAAGVASQCQSVFGELLELREAGDRRGSGLPLSQAESVARALRGALLRFAIDPPPAALSGHEADGRPLDRPHVAFLALPVPGGARAPATIGGAAIVLPREIEEAERRAILLAAARWEASGARLVLGRLGELRLTRAASQEEAQSSCASTLTAPSRRWASLTPIALHKNPGNLASRDPAAALRAAREAERTIADACEHIGLPRPIHVHVARQSSFPGIPSAPAFMPYPRHGGGFKRVCVHAELEFEEPVHGPVVLGVGRYFGVGLCTVLDGVTTGAAVVLGSRLEPRR